MAMNSSVVINTLIMINVGCVIGFCGSDADLRWLTSLKQHVASSVLKGCKWGFEIRGLKANSCFVYL